jgi:hypothetical protein
MLQRIKRMGLMFGFCTRAPGGCCHSSATHSNTTATSSTLCKPLLPPAPTLSLVFTVPLLRLRALQIDSDITSEACLVCSRSFLHQRWAFSQETEKAPPKSRDLPLFHYANNMLCCLHRIHPIVADSDPPLGRGDTVTALADGFFVSHSLLCRGWLLLQNSASLYLRAV